ncbi:unnamed protein product [Rotaria magnacalcarata]|uniref:Uncharacterized protein n=3 Tax=Rotaria magnacalcarata TaxID=392030 RepID=A0A816MNV2_9BILA|nr:unnamed protein product [Rotaria magnacalcarata]CAF1439964.1 unnamed protein product [Rotaria magnacalcarata]CAF2009450.1 unnamed protein product [Rotaria magnacalcarata]CAF2092479.1 unnamed protein product [Rotaria magnacalcarata]CAF2134648.1 unnamed protein product [Rotaria magnacalcarata]
MSGLESPNMDHHSYEQPGEYNQFILKQNWTSSIFREEAALLHKLVTGNDKAPEYVTSTETQRQYQHPTVKSVEHLKHIEENDHGRHAYKPDRYAPNGILPTFNAKAYPEVIPRFHLPKMPY